MTLDLAAVAGQVRALGQEAASNHGDFRDCVRWARRLMAENSTRFSDIAGAVKLSKEARTARAAVPLEPLAARQPAPVCPDSYVAAAADGSQAEPDRHGHVAYYLINIGTVLIRYGNKPGARLHSLPRLFYRSDDLVVVQERQPTWPPDQESQRVPVDGDILAMKRSVAEVEDLVRLARDVPPDLPALLLLDGTLTLFAKASGPDDWVSEQFLRQYRAALEQIHSLGIPVAGFISRSNATWVMDMLQVGVCRRQAAACSFCSNRSGDTRNTCALADLRDRFLFDDTVDQPSLPPLQPGERSALFLVSSGLYQDYGPNEPAMFYLNTGREIAQVQIPLWVARDNTLLAQVHALVYAQCVNGNGYPTVLTRAHEQAVVSAADREALDDLVLAQLIKRNIRVPLSEKARSKQVRGI